MPTQMTFDAPAPFKGRKAHFWFFDSMAEAADKAQSDSKYHSRKKQRSWCGGHDFAQACKAAREGDIASVEASDKLLEKMEAYGLATVKAQWIDDVAGAIPNVPAHIAGHPLSMRRKAKAASAAAPIAIIVDLTTSAAIEPNEARARGVAILALVRALSQRRPVELWACAGLDADNYRNACFVTVKIDTAPLDLAHAAHCLTHVGFPRQILYGLALEFGYSGHWPFGQNALTRSQMEAVCAPAFSHVSETLCLPGVHANDENLKDPEGWLARQIAEHDPIALREAAE